MWTDFFYTSVANMSFAGENLISRRRRLEKKYGVDILDANIWVSQEDLEIFAKQQTMKVLVDPQGNALVQARGLTAIEGKRDILKAKHSFLFRYPWDLLRAHELSLFEAEQNPPGIYGEIDSSVRISDWFFCGKGTQIHPGTVIQGPVFIGENCEIGPNVYLRGPVSIGNNCSIGHASELKNVFCRQGTQISSLCYLGDSVIGREVAIGAGTVVANVRHDGASHLSMWEDKLIDVGRLKFGTILGDDVQIAVKTCFYPGRKVGLAKTTKPGEIVRYDLLKKES